jgi:hypothetical protein
MDTYKEYFSELHTNTQKGVKAPQGNYAVERY